MGYHGTGLYRWIYTQKPRRPFTKDRKPTGDVTEYHHQIEKDNSRYPHKTIRKKARLNELNQLIEYRRKRGLANSRLNLAFGVVIGLFLVVLMVVLYYKGVIHV